MIQVGRRTGGWMLLLTCLHSMYSLEQSTCCHCEGLTTEASVLDSSLAGVFLLMIPSRHLFHYIFENNLKSF